MKVVVTGGRGQLAQAIQRVWRGHDVILPEESVLDLSQRVRVLDTILSLKPDVVINAGAFTQVDRCETDVDLAMRINGEAVAWLVEACAQAGSRLVQVSTDYVFDGRGARPYREEDPANPQTVYGKSKLLGEEEARKLERHLIVRTAWLYDAWGANFYKTMLHMAAQGRSLRVVDDQCGTPTSCRALARQLQVAVEEGWCGTLHGTCAGETTWFGFAAEIFRQSGVTAVLDPCSTEAFPRPAPRPSYSVLCGDKRRRLGGDVMPDWREALAEVVAWNG